MSLRWEGLHEYVADMSAQPDRIRGRVRTATITAGSLVERDSKANSPVNTGNLRASIGTTVTGGGDVITAEVGPTASYGHYVELGTSRMAPQPYLFPAAEANSAAWLAALEQAMGG